MDNYGGYDPNQGQDGQGFDQSQDFGGGFDQPIASPNPVIPKSNAPKIIAIAVVVIALAAAAVVLLMMNRIKGTYKKTQIPFDTGSGIVYEDITLELDGKNFTLRYDNVTFDGESYPELSQEMKGTYKKNGKYVTFYVDGEEFDNALIKKGGKTLQFFDSSGADAFALDKQ